jgi:uncharacterized protein with HEPN domain
VRSDHDRLQDILNCTERITRHGQVDGPEDLVLDAVLHNLVVIGEAVRGLSETCREREPAVRWPAIVSMRNLLTHEYFRARLRELPSTGITGEEIVADIRAERDRLG